MTFFCLVTKMSHSLSDFYVFWFESQQVLTLFFDCLLSGPLRLRVLCV